MRTFRDVLDMLCRSRGVSYVELARRIGVTKSYIGQVVHGHIKPPRAERCRQLADALELSGPERRHLLDLAVRERARSEARGKIEELDDALDALRSAAAELLAAVVAHLAPDGEAPPDLFAGDELLAGLHALVTAAGADPQAAAGNLRQGV